ncbi:hypothetical protein [Novosphingobium humi]|uniref:Uncharacterized protein n=1 Tax=Novosphingobium humi TaxID=2282397 RepID=A0ABY7TTN3_9SPHN|nr:hypothetical protein [Novosphingobium humi]WCT76588.1 hypothetical protein PQ457_11655 [Novosphingobium humi]
MTARSFTLVTLTSIILLLLGGNRSIPKWQGFANISLNSSEKCAADVLSRFGQLEENKGYIPEGGVTRLFIRSFADGKRSRPTLTVSLHGNARFSSVFMDATDDKKADAAWRQLQRQCKFN